MNTVRVYDFETKEITTIPAAELAQGMVRVKVVGIDGDVFVDIGQLKEQMSPAEYQHPPLDDDKKEVIRFLYETLGDVFPMTPEQWEDGFRRDLHMDQEIGYWCLFAETFRHFTEGRELRQDQRQEIFKVIHAAMSNGLEHVLATVSCRTLSRRRIVEIAKYATDWNKRTSK